jgi:predicted MFS family arabinose efflux permease
VGAFLGSWLGGVALEATGSYDSMWLADLGLAIAAAAVALTIRERSRPGQHVPAASSGRSAVATAA